MNFVIKQMLVIYSSMLTDYNYDILYISHICSRFFKYDL